MDDLNILILSCGSRNKIIQYFKQELKGIGKVYAADCSKLAPALYDADYYFILPKITEESYIEEVMQICKEYNIKAVLSLIDPELSLLAKYKQKFLQIGTIPVISDYDKIELCFDKYKFYIFLESIGLKAIKSYVDKHLFYSDLNKGLINYPVFVKPVTGSASININKVYSQEEIEILFSRFDNLMIQEYINGQEIGADVYIDLISNEPVAIFTKEKIKMRAGETDKSRSFKDEGLFQLIIEFTKKIGLKGVIDIDIFKVNGEYIISEVNPRFGGGYPHAYECGVNIPRLIINNLLNIENKVEIGKYEDNSYMLKYSEIKTI